MFPIDAPVPEFTPELSHELKTALERAQDAATGEHRIDQALRSARNELAATQGDLETVRNRLGQAEAAQALTGGEPDKQSRRRLLALR